MIETLKQIDTRWFLEINNHWQNEFLDLVLPFFRNAKNWIPLYLAIIFFTYKTQGKNWWKVLLTACILVLITDQFSANLVKNTFERLRPCNEPALKNMVRNLVPCGGGYSFMSAHATNHFGLAVFFSNVFKFQFKQVWIVALIWAGLIAIAQVYVGVHYPMDVIAGAICGIIFGTVAYRLMISKLS